MSAKSGHPAYLRLVASSITESTRKRGGALQLDLFGTSDPTTLGLLLLTSAMLRTFTSMIALARPRYVIDVRPLPSFDAVGTSRRTVLRSMNQLGIVYIDALGSLGVRERRHAFIHSGALGEYVHSVCGARLTGPLFFLFDSEDDLTSSVDLLPGTLKSALRRKWRVRVFKSTTVSG